MQSYDCTNEESNRHYVSGFCAGGQTNSDQKPGALASMI